MKAERVAEILARHGVGTDAPPGELIDALRGRGWRVVVGEGADRTGHRRVTATAWRTAGSAALGVPYRQTLRATKPTEGAALADLLAKALEQNA